MAQWPQDYRFSTSSLLLYVSLWSVALAVSVPFTRTISNGWTYLLVLAALAALLALVFAHTRDIAVATWAAPLLLCLVPLSALIVAGLTANTMFDGEMAVRDASYAEYAQLCDTEAFDPVGADHISWYSYFRRDYGIAFFKMEIDNEDYRRLVGAREAALADRDCRCIPTDSVGVDTLLDQLKDKEVSRHRPNWWTPPNVSDGVVCVTFQCDDGRGLAKFTRAVWIYDQTRGLLWCAEVAR